ncbi:IS66-like element accessory protein TnpA [Pararhizobium sp. PWRC1-1]|uniref:IS66-like element accessory protein TnpA n=1 Tax=Pararhizobium sp. PWRC1-1 TaxID=2804566 RepID=UPI003CEAE182
MEIISGIERRRRWPDEAKLGILAEADQPGVRIGDVARRHDIHPGQIRLWRQRFSGFTAPATFLPVELVKEVNLGQAPATRPALPIVEILLKNGRGLKVPADLERRMLASLIACVEAA